MPLFFRAPFLPLLPSRHHLSFPQGCLSQTGTDIPEVTPQLNGSQFLFGDLLSNVCHIYAVPVRSMLAHCEVSLQFCGGFFPVAFGLRAWLFVLGL